jgi:transcriptional regulator with XRE-family HTH domain
LQCKKIQAVLQYGRRADTRGAAVRVEGIREARKARGWTQEQLGKRAGLQTALIGSYEVGRRPLHRKDAKKISEALKMTDSLQVRIDNTTRKFERAQDKGDAKGAVKAAGRLIELAEEAGEDGSYTVDWEALENLVDGLAEQMGVQYDEDEPVPVGRALDQ